MRKESSLHDVSKQPTAPMSPNLVVNDRDYFFSDEDLDYQDSTKDDNKVLSDEQDNIKDKSQND